MSIDKLSRRGLRGACSGHLLLVLAVISAAAIAQAQDQPETAVNVSLGVSTAKPSEVIDIPITISGPKDAKIGAVSFKVSLKKGPLQYMSGEAGLAGEESQVTVDVNSKEDGDQLVLEANVTAKQPMKYGILAYLKFKAAKDVKKGEISLKLSDVKVSGMDNAMIAVSKGKDGEVSVFEADEEIPVVGCFFFSH